MKKLVWLVMLVSLLSADEYREEISEGLFSQGQKNFGFVVGASSGYGEDYTVVGANINYFVIDNLSMGLGYQGWFGGDPSIHEFNIPITYYYPYSDNYHPYFGAMYKHTFIDAPYEDYNVYGGRIGLAMQAGGSSYISFGWVQEYRDYGKKSESEGYPEISMGIVF